MQKVLSAAQVATVHSMIEANAIARPFLETCECMNCGKMGDPLHDFDACYQSDYVQWRAMRDAELFELRFDELPEFDEEESEECEQWDSWDDADEPYFARLEREGWARAMAA